jgi:hypothetical protein
MRLFATVFFVSAAFSGCKQRNFSETKSTIEIWDKDDTKREITVSVTGNEIYLPAKLRSEFGKAAAAAIKDPVFGVQGLLGFAAAPLVKKLQTGSLTPDEFAAQHWVKVNDDDAMLLYFIQKTQNGLFETGSGMIGGDIFGEGNYRRRVWFGNDINQKNTGIEPITSLSKLMNWQPWFKWIRETGSFEFKTSGAAMQILNHLQAMSDKKKTITLYRGASQPQTPGNYRAASLDPYENPLKDAKLIFTTTSRAGALRFADPYLLKAEVSFDALRELVSGPKPSLYVGIEFDYPEFAFLVTQAPTNIWFNSAATECTIKETPGYKLCSN